VIFEKSRAELSPIKLAAGKQVYGTRLIQCWLPMFKIDVRKTHFFIYASALAI
jgi:hypothetical protein